MDRRLVAPAAINRLRELLRERRKRYEGTVRLLDIHFDERGTRRSFLALASGILVPEALALTSRGVEAATRQRIDVRFEIHYDAKGRPRRRRHNLGRFALVTDKEVLPQLEAKGFRYEADPSNDLFLTRVRKGKRTAIHGKGSRVAGPALYFFLNGAEIDASAPELVMPASRSLLVITQRVWAP